MASPVSGNSNSSVSALTKRVYKDGLAIETFQNRPYWTLINKQADSSLSFVGSTFQFALMSNDLQARSPVFASAQAQSRGLSAYNTSGLTGTIAGAPGAGAIGVTQFTVPRISNYALASITTELELSARDKRGAFDDAVIRITDSALNVLGNDMEISLLGGGFTASGVAISQSGILSQISASSASLSGSTGVITLQYASDCSRFSVGQELDLYWSNSGTMTKRTLAGSAGMFVGSVDRMRGTITIVNASGTAVAVTSVFSDATTGDYIVASGDFNAKVNSFESWIPFGGPVSDSPSNLFCGVNRAAGDVTRLAGSWVDATGGIGTNAGTTLNIEDALMLATTINGVQSSKSTDTIAMNQLQLLKLLRSNMSRTVLPGGKMRTSVPELSFSGIEVETAGGPVMVLPDRFCAANRIYALHMPSWSYVHLGDPVNQYDLDGRDSLREPDLDARSMRFYSMGNVVCDEPAAQVTINIAA